MVRGQFVQLDKLDLGDIHQSKVQAVVIPGANVSLLGQPFSKTSTKSSYGRARWFCGTRKDL